MLVCQDVTKTFGGLRALDRVSLDVEAGEIVGLVGPNGAGKSTLLGVISGNYAPHSGRVLFDGQDITGLPPHQVVRRGLARTFQRSRVWPSLSVRENVALASRASRDPLSRRNILGVNRGPIGTDARTGAILQRVGLSDLAPLPARVLSYGQKRLLEIGRALAGEPELIVLDEPTAGMNDRERAGFGEVVRPLAAEGVAILLVEHALDVIHECCARVFVLDFGKIIFSGSPSAMVTNERVVSAYLG
ncbi:MAG: ABC transporter ATP-binding protein [Candidatus Rokubacteria bacterium]|nr:ABC transporter ATP-binding protein [Candidatus Rokubacteria bacterium]